MAQKRGTAFLLAGVLALAARADRVELTNGRSLDGVVVEDTPEEVVVSIGVGQIRLKRAQIKAIHKGTTEDQARLQETWQARYFTNPRFVPPRYADLATTFNRLEQQRQGALNALRDSKAVKARQRKLMQEAGALEAEWRAAQEALLTAGAPGSLKQPGDVQRYNALVQRSNMAGSRRQLNGETARTVSDQLAALSGNVSNYLGALAGFEAQYAVAPPAADEAERIFRREMDKRRANYRHDVNTAELALEGEADRPVLTVRLNGVAGRFILDTGASTVVLSEAFARRLNLDLRAAPRVTISLADASTTEAACVLLNSVELDRFRSEDVRAMVLPQPPGPGVDGLLGMSFLRDYVIRYDAPNRKITLSALNAGR